MEIDTQDDTPTIDSEQPVHLQVHPRVRDGAVAQVPLRGLGIHNRQLRVRVRVTG